MTLELPAGVMALDKRFDEAVEYARRAEATIRAAFPADAPPLTGAPGTKGFVEARRRCG